MRRDALLRALLAGAALFAAALWLSRGWLLDPAPYFPERDSGFSALAMDHLRAALLGGADWREAPLAWPARDGTTNADWMLGQALLTLPLDLAGVDPSRLYELAGFFGLVATAWAGAALAAALVGPGPHTLLAGLVIGLGPLQLAHAQHANLVHHEAMLLTALLLGAGLAADRPGRAAAGGAGVALAFHFGLYMGLHTLLAAVGVVIWQVFARRASKQTWGAALGGFGAAALTLAPMITLYGGAAGETSVPTDETVQGSWDPGLTLGLTQGAPLHDAIVGLLPFKPFTAPESANPGFLVGILAIVGLVAVGRPRGAWATVAGVAFVACALALGPTPRWALHPLGLPGPHRLLEELTGDNLRQPMRWLLLGHTAVALYASAGLAALLTRLPAAARPVVTVLTLALALAELPHRPEEPATEPNRALCLLDTVDTPGALLEVFGRGCECAGTPRLRAALFHHRPLVGGSYARFTPALQATNRVLHTWPSEAAQRFARLVEVAVVLEHKPLRGPPPEGATCEESQGHRLCRLPPHRPVPAPEAVTTEGDGPIVGVRWDLPPNAREITVTCGDRVETSPVDTWRAFAGVRGVRTLDVFLEAPCEGEWSTSPTGAVGLHADAAKDRRWLPSVGEPGKVAALFPEGCPALSDAPSRATRP